MDEKRKKQVVFIGSMLVAVMFISSYAAFGNNSGYTSITSTSTIPPTVAFFGTANGVVSGYSTAATVELSNGIVNTTAGKQIVDILSNLEINGSVNSYQQFSNNFTVFLSNMDAYSLEQLLQTRLNTTSVTVNASSYIVFPNRIMLNISHGKAYSVILPSNTFLINILPLRPIGASVKIGIAASVYQNNSTVEISQIRFNPM